MTWNSFAFLVGLLVVIGFIAIVVAWQSDHPKDWESIKDSAAAILLVYVGVLVLSVIGGLLDFFKGLKRKEDRSRHDRIDRYLGRWNGIWCKYDEAIMSLQFADRHASEVLPNVLGPSRVESLMAEDQEQLAKARKKIRIGPDRQSSGGLLHLLGGVVFGVAKVVLSVLVWPIRLIGLLVANHIFTSQTQRVASGDDLVFESFGHVSPTPSSRFGDITHGLPESYEALVLEHAVDVFGHKQASIRKSLTLENMKSSAFEDATAFTNGLVHCSYFSVDEVVELIAAGIRLAKDDDGTAESPGEPDANRAAELSPAAANWVRSRREAVNQCLQHTE